MPSLDILRPKPNLQWHRKPPYITPTLSILT